jgi:hypothetical protein
MVVSRIAASDVLNYKVRDTDEICVSCCMSHGVVLVKGRGHCWPCAFHMALGCLPAEGGSTYDKLSKILTKTGCRE